MADQNQWLLARGERDGFPMIVRMAAGYRGMSAHPGYDHHIIVGAKLRTPTSAGFPSTEEGDDLQRFEENLSAALEIDNESVCVLVVTNHGIRDFIFYTRDPYAAKARIDAALSGLQGFRFEVAIEPDREWEIYRAFDKRLAPLPKLN